MSPSQQKRKGLRLFAGAAPVLVICVVLILGSFQTPIRAYQDTGDTQKAAVPKGSEPVDIAATVVAMSRGPWSGVGYSFYLLILRIDKVITGQEPARYVRADFPLVFVEANSEGARVYSQLVHSLREPKSWKIHLRPPRGSPECWTVPPPPTPGDMLSGANPVMLPVAGASGYPGINTVPCYVFNQTEIQEITAPEKAASGKNN